MRQNWRRFRVGWVLVPLGLIVLFGGWSQTTPGVVQRSRWQLMAMDKDGADISGNPICGNSIEELGSVETALTVDLVAGVKNNPFPELWMRWFVLQREDEMNASKGEVIASIAESSATLKDEAKAQLVLSQALKAAEAIEDDGRYLSKC